MPNVRKRIDLIYILLSLLVSSCVPVPLSIQTQTLNHTMLASYHIGTPDPRKQSPLLGKRLLVQWCIPRTLLKEYPFLTLIVRSCQHEEKKIVRPITTQCGTFIYEITGEEFLRSGGVMSYCASLCTASGQQISVWRHPLWVPLIHIGQETGAYYPSAPCCNGKLDNEKREDEGK